MNIINSSSTGYSRPQERNFSKKLFIGLGIAIVAAMILFLIAGQRKDMAIAPTKETESNTNDSGSASGMGPTPISEQPKN